MGYILGFHIILVKKQLIMNDFTGLSSIFRPPKGPTLGLAKSSIYWMNWAAIFSENPKIESPRVMAWIFQFLSFLAIFSWAPECRTIRTPKIHTFAKMCTSSIWAQIRSFLRQIWNFIAIMCGTEFIANASPIALKLS